MILPIAPFLPVLCIPESLDTRPAIIDRVHFVCFIFVEGIDTGSDSPFAVLILCTVHWVGHCLSYRVLSSTVGIRVSLLQLGAMPIGPAWSPAMGTVDK